MPFWVQLWSRMQSRIVFCGSIEGNAGKRCFPTSRERRTVFGTAITMGEVSIEINEHSIIGPIVYHTDCQDDEESSYRYPQSQKKRK